MDEDKIEAIVVVATTNKKKAHRFLGLITYMGRFINNLSGKTKPLRDLIKNYVVFQWNQEQDAFQKNKNAIIEGTTLQYVVVFC